MRFTVFVTLLLVALGAASKFLPEQYRPKLVAELPGLFEKRVVAPLERLSFERGISFEGLSVLQENQLLSVLPGARSNFYWLTFSKQLERHLESNPWVKEASLRRCRWYQINCYAVTIQEHEPRFLVEVSGTRWLVSNEGVFISPEETGEHYQLPLVHGIALENGSLDLMRARLAHVSKVLSVFESSSGQTVRALRLTHNGEFSLTLRQLDLEIVVGQSHSKSVDEIEKQASRLKTLLARLGPGIEGFERLDLGFSRVGVARLRPDASLIQEEQEGSQSPRS